MKISIMEKTSEYRGDHAADISIAHEYIENETVEGLIDRCLSTKNGKDFVELRIVIEKTDPKEVPF